MSCPGNFRSMTIPPSIRVRSPDEEVGSGALVARVVSVHEVGSPPADAAEQTDHHAEHDQRHQAGDDDEDVVPEVASMSFHQKHLHYVKQNEAYSSNHVISASYCSGLVYSPTQL